MERYSVGYACLRPSYYFDILFKIIPEFQKFMYDLSWKPWIDSSLDFQYMGSMVAVHLIFRSPDLENKFLSTLILRSMTHILMLGSGINNVNKFQNALKCQSKVFLLHLTKYLRPNWSSIFSSVNCCDKRPKSRDYCLAASSHWLPLTWGPGWRCRAAAGSSSRCRAPGGGAAPPATSALGLQIFIYAQRH